MYVEKLVTYSILSTKDISVGYPAMKKDGEFDKWMQQIDQYMWQLLGCSLYDLPGYDYDAMFVAGNEPEEMVNIVLEVSGLQTVG